MTNEDFIQSDAPVIELAERAERKEFKYTRLGVNRIVRQWLKINRPHIPSDGPILAAFPTSTRVKNNPYSYNRKRFFWNIRDRRSKKERSESGDFVLVELFQRPAARYHVRVRRIYVVPRDLLSDKTNIKLYVREKQTRHEPHWLEEHMVEDHAQAYKERLRLRRAGLLPWTARGGRAEA